MSKEAVAAARAIFDGFNARDIPAATSTLAPDFVLTDHGSGQTPKGVEEFGQFLSSWVAAFSDGLLTDTEWHDAGTVVVAQSLYVGTNDGSFAGQAPTGRRVNLPLCCVWHVDNAGRVTSQDAYYDVAGLMAQLSG